MAPIPSHQQYYNIQLRSLGRSQSEISYWKRNARALVWTRRFVLLPERKLQRRRSVNCDLRDAAETLIEETQESPEESAKDILVTLMLLLVVAFLVRKEIVKVLGRVPDLPGIPSPV